MKNLLSVLFLTLTIGLWAQAPQSINYQAVARDASGQIMDAQSGMVRVSILDAVGGNIMYQEEHAVTTNQFGLFTIAIGKGTALQGSFSAINWGAGDRYLNIEADFGSGYEDMGTTQLLSVPYALYAEKSGDGPPGKNSLIDYSPAPAATCPNGGYVVKIGIDGNGNSILDSPEIKGSFNICNGADGSATSLIAGQGIDIDFFTNTINNTGDLDSTNEIQTLNYNSTTQDLSISNGNTVTLDINDADNDPANELITSFGLNTTNDSLVIVQSGVRHTFAMSNFYDDDWLTNGTHIYNGNTGNVGIGTNNPLNPLDISHTTATANNSAMHIGYTYSGSALGVNSGLYIQSNNNSTENVWGIYSKTSGTTQLNEADIAVAGYAQAGGAGEHRGIDAGAFATSGINYALFASASGGTTNWAGYFHQGNVYVADNVGVGTTSPLSKLDVNGQITMRTGAVPGYIPVSNANGTMIWTDPTSISFGNQWIPSGTDIYNGNVGNVQIRTNLDLTTDTSSITFAQGGSTNAPEIYMFSGGIFNPARMILAHSPNYPGWGLEYRDTSDMFVFKRQTADVMAIDLQNQRVGIGTTSPAFQLTLSANSAAKPSTNTWTVISDRRLKKDIKPYKGGLEDVLKINPVWFTYNGKAGMPFDTGVGVIAQELQKIAPYMVKEWEYTPYDEKTGEKIGPTETYLGVDNGAMTYMLINAVKEQQQMIEELKKEIELLKQEIKQLK